MSLTLNLKDSLSLWDSAMAYVREDDGPDWWTLWRLRRERQSGNLSLKLVIYDNLQCYIIEDWEERVKISYYNYFQKSISGNTRLGRKKGKKLSTSWRKIRKAIRGTHKQETCRTRQAEEHREGQDAPHIHASETCTSCGFKEIYINKYTFKS